MGYTFDFILSVYIEASGCMSVMRKGPSQRGKNLAECLSPFFLYLCLRLIIDSITKLFFLYMGSRRRVAEAWKACVTFVSSRLSQACATLFVRRSIIIVAASPAVCKSTGSDCRTMGGMTRSERPRCSWNPENPVDALTVFII